jgi:hypothetical protein
MKKKTFLNGFVSQAMGKGFGIDLPSVVMGSKMFQNPPWKRPKKCYRTICSLGKSQPKPQMCDTTGNNYRRHLNRCPPRFSEG